MVASRIVRLIPAVLLIVLTLAVFSPLWVGGRFFWDDYILLVDNPHVHEAGLGGVYDIWFTTKNPDYFPLTSTLFWVEWRLWGGAQWPQLYHLVNVLLHIGSSLLLWRIFRRLRVRGAFLIALLFAIHPVNVESAAWIAEGKNTLSMLCMCAAVWLYLRFERRGRWGIYAAALGCFLLALLAKTAVVMLPFVLLLLAWFQRRRIVWGDVARAAPFFGLSLLLGLVTLYFQYHRAIADIVVRNDSFASRLAMAGWAVWFYLGHALVPVGITFNYPRWDVMSYGALAFVPPVLLAGLFVGLWMWRRGPGRGMLAGLGAYVLMLAPILGFLNIFFMRYSLVSDHWQYQAIPAVLAAAIGVAAHMTRRWGRPTRMIAAAVLVGVLAADSFSIAVVYCTPESIWQDTLAHNPESWLAHAQLGELYLNEAQRDSAQLPRALEHLAAVVQLQPQRAVGYVNLGNGYVIAGQIPRATDCYMRGLSAPGGSANDRARLYQGLGSLEAKAGRYAAAEADFQRAFALNPESFSINLYLGMTLVYEHKPEEARAAIQRALAIEPENATALSLMRQLVGTATERAPK